MTPTRIISSAVLLKLVAGLLQLDEGIIEVGTRNVGMLFQKNALFDSFTCEENLMFPLKERMGIIGQPARDKAARDRAKLNLEYTRVRAPISGRISRRMIDPWNMVKAEETPLTTVVSLDQMYAYFDVDEATALRTREELVRFFDGMELAEPGVVTCSRWRPDVMEIGEDADVTHFGGVARKT